MAETNGKFTLTTQIFIALILGFIVGIIINQIGHNEFITTYLVEGLFKVCGKIFINTIKMMVVPLVFVSLIGGVIGIGDIKKLGRVGGKTLAFYLMTTAIAISLALLIANILNPGLGLDIQHSQAEIIAKEAPSLANVLINIVPSNPIKAMVEGQMLQVIFFSLITGIAIASIGKGVEHVHDMIDGLNEVVMKMINIIMIFAPYGIFCLIAKVFSEQGIGALLPLIKYMIAVLVTLVLHLILVYTGALKLFTGLSITTFFKKFYPTMMVAFSTASSNATIPITMKSVTEKMGVSKGISSFSIPFGATINMDGTAIMQGVAVIFISQIYGVDLGMSEFLMVILTATLASIGTAGVPGVGLITLSMVLTQVNLPVEGIAIIMGVDRLLDMARTAINICGDSIVSIIVAKSEGEFNEAVYNDPNAGTDFENKIDPIIES